MRIKDAFYTREKGYVSNRCPLCGHYALQMYWENGRFCSHCEHCGSETSLHKSTGNAWRAAQAGEFSIINPVADSIGTVRFVPENKPIEEVIAEAEEPVEVLDKKSQDNKYSKKKKAK